MDVDGGEGREERRGKGTEGMGGRGGKGEEEGGGMGGEGLQPPNLNSWRRH